MVWQSCVVCNSLQCAPENLLSRVLPPVLRHLQVAYQSQTCRPAERRAENTHFSDCLVRALHRVTADSKAFGVRVSTPVRCRPHHEGARFNLDKVLVASQWVHALQLVRHIVNA